MAEKSKKCIKCSRKEGRDIFHSIFDFLKDSRRPDGYRSSCTIWFGDKQPPGLTISALKRAEFEERIDGFSKELAEKFLYSADWKNLQF